MSISIAEVEESAASALSAIAGAKDLAELKVVKIEHLGDKSGLSKASQALGKVAAEEKATFGKIVGEAKAKVSAAFEARIKVLEANRDARVLIEERVDVTLPATNIPKGGLHPLTILTNEISDLFLGLGYRVAEGPELEAEWLNFDALNIPADHPAANNAGHIFYRAARFKVGSANSYLTGSNSNNAREQAANLCYLSGRTYRADELDATHTPVFSQVEGLVIDRGITMADLKGTLDYFAQGIFGPDVVTRLRPSFFPFTEPSAEVDFFFNGRWIEWGGCGMVNPKVLEVCGIDTKEFSGFAFGMGLERTLMVRHGITDMHDIVEGDIRFTRSFGLGIK